MIVLCVGLAIGFVFWLVRLAKIDNLKAYVCGGVKGGAFLLGCPRRIHFL